MPEVSAVNTNIPQKKNNMLRTAAGNTVGAAISLASCGWAINNRYGSVSMEKLNKKAKKYSFVDSFENIKPMAEKMLEETGLKEKEVKILWVDGSKESLDELNRIINKSTPRKNWRLRRLNHNAKMTLGVGANAMYSPREKTIICHTGNICKAVAHEIGHAIDIHNSHFVKKLFNWDRKLISTYDIPKIAPFVIGIGLLHEVNKTKPSSEKNKKDKMLDFISNNAGKFLFASYIPMLMIEGRASNNGLKAGKSHMGNKFSKYVTSYIGAFIHHMRTPIVVSAGVALGIWAANKIKNSGKSKQA